MVLNPTMVRPTFLLSEKTRLKSGGSVVGVAVGYGVLVGMGVLMAAGWVGCGVMRVGVGVGAMVAVAGLARRMVST